MPKKQTEWSRAYNEKAYDRISVTVPKGRKGAIEAFYRERDESINRAINRLIRAEMGLSEDEWRRTEE